MSCPLTCQSETISTTANLVYLTLTYSLRKAYIVSLETPPYQLTFFKAITLHPLALRCWYYQHSSLSTQPRGEDNTLRCLVEAYPFRESTPHFQAD